MLETGIDLLVENVMEDDGVPIMVLLPFALRKKNLPKDPSEYSSLTQKQKAAHWAWHLEMESQHAKTFAQLIEACKEYNVFAFWGEQVLVTEMVDFDSPQGEVLSGLLRQPRGTPAINVV